MNSEFSAYYMALRHFFLSKPTATSFKSCHLLVITTAATYSLSAMWQPLFETWFLVSLSFWKRLLKVFLCFGRLRLEHWTHWIHSDLLELHCKLDLTQLIWIWIYCKVERFFMEWRYRGYYMAARGYEFYLQALKVSLKSERSERVRDTFSTRR